MKDESKTKAELIKELKTIRKERENSAVNNIADRNKQAEEKLQDSEEYLKTLFDYAPDAYYINDLKGNFIDGNKAAERLTGYKREELIGKSFLKLKLLSLTAIPKAAKLLAKNLRGQPTGPDKFILNRKDNSKVTVELSTYPVKIKGRTLVLGIARDVTERKQAEEALRTSEERYRLLVENANEAILVAQDGMLKFVNRMMVELMGCSEQELTSRPFLEFIHPDDRNMVGERYLRRLKGDVSIPRYAFRWVTRDDSIKWVEVGAVLIDWEGRPATLNFLNDVTERKQAEEALQTAYDQLEDKVAQRTKELQKAHDQLEIRVKERTAELQTANEELKAFSYSVSHDLRAPLRSIDGFSKMIQEDYSTILDKQGQHYFQRIRTATQNMGQLIDDLLDLSRIGRQLIKKKLINLGTIIKKVYQDLHSEWKDRKVNFTVHQCPSVSADPNLMQIVFMNLLSNALKFTRKQTTTEIEVGYKKKNNQTVFFVKDNGIGFDMKYADKLFTPFQRLHRAEEYEGTGIGLATVQRIINRHGGQIWVESKSDSGTTFFFTL